MNNVTLFPSGTSFACPARETVLEAALSAGMAVHYGCSNGNCGRCRARLVSGETHLLRHGDYVFRAAEKQSGWFLMCCHGCSGDITIEVDTVEGSGKVPQQTIETRIRRVTPLNDHLYALSLRTPRSQRLQFLAGQSLTLDAGAGHRLDMVIASCPCDDRNIELHVSDSELALLGLTECSDNGRLVIEGPTGSFVLDEKDTGNLLLIAINRGFPAIRSLAEHALSRNGERTVRLIWLTRGGFQHYQTNHLRAWSDAFDDFAYRCEEGESEPAPIGQQLKRILDSMVDDDPQSYDVYCDCDGDPVSLMQDKLTDLGFDPNKLHLKN